MYKTQPSGAGWRKGAPGARACLAPADCITAACTCAVRFCTATASSWYSSTSGRPNTHPHGQPHGRPACATCLSATGRALQLLLIPTF
eukprot:1183901-Prorocentrum_minimum.AAC.3